MFFFKRLRLRLPSPRSFGCIINVNEPETKNIIISQKYQKRSKIYMSFVLLTTHSFNRLLFAIPFPIIKVSFQTIYYLTIFLAMGQKAKSGGVRSGDLAAQCLPRRRLLSAAIARTLPSNSWSILRIN